ncbi:MAG TPA: bifunctional DNA-binding transcriptional regulator/O6-methylguanine-DNA methyltransferase Ada [Bryobacteraceae bacterium]|nr:bifunctional DNA-binding transcriptional regulator/O6-methylguanine-DNA methyltransferase Ada [Bryobacteraceae bacterium]
MQTQANEQVERWQLVLERDPLADGQFVYAVRSTGVYCRPTCPSRRPNANQVEFFETPQEAERAGYRSCRRCNPQGARPSAEAIAAACRYLKEHLDCRVALSDIAQHVKLSPFHFQRLFKQQTGVSPREYHASLRNGKVRSSLRQSASVTESVYDAGFSSSSRFYESAGRDLGMSPSAWRKGGQGVEVRFTTFSSPFGRIVVAATDKGVCFLALAEHDKELEAALRCELPAAQFFRDDAALAAYRDVIAGYLAGATPQPDLPLDIRATAFQAQVWKILRSIAPGQTRAYSDIALELGDVNLTRAVARACASNPVPLVIPCHRVVGKSGKLTGYRWGVARKEKLLARERDGR